MEVPYWLSPYGGGTVHSGLGYCTSVIKKLSQRYASRPTLVQLLSWVSFFPVCSSGQKLNLIETAHVFFKKIKNLLIYIFIVCIWCVYLCDVCMEMAQTWRSEDLFWESIFFPSTLGWNLRWSGLQNYHFYSKVSLQPISINLSLFCSPPPSLYLYLSLLDPKDRT